VSQEIAIVVVQSFVCRPHFVHFQTFMAVKLLLFHIRQNTGYDFFASETYPFISDDRRFQVDGAKSSIVNLSTLPRQLYDKLHNNQIWLNSSICSPRGKGVNRLIYDHFVVRKTIYNKSLYYKKIITDMHLHL
jgi:hypothetical protein